MSGINVKKIQIFLIISRPIFLQASSRTAFVFQSFRSCTITDQLYHDWITEFFLDGIVQVKLIVVQNHPSPFHPFFALRYSSQQNLRSSRIQVALISYESKPTDKREQYDWMAERKLNG